MSNWWILGALAIMVWLTVYNLIELAGTRVFWNKQWHGRPWIPPGLVTLRQLWSAAGWVFFMFVMFGWAGSQPPPLSEAMPLGMIGGLGFALSARSLESRRSRAAGRPSTNLPFWNAWRSSGWNLSHGHVRLALFWMIYMPVVLFLPLGGWLPVFVFAPMIYFYLESFRRRKAAPGGTVEMEELPLLVEIRKIHTSFRYDLKQVFVSPGSIHPDHTPIPLFSLENQHRGKRLRLIIPKENLRDLNPSTYTAALASNYALQLFTGARRLSAVDPFLPLFLFFAFLAMLAALVAYSSWGAFGPNPWSIGSTAVLLPLLLVLTRQYHLQVRPLMYQAAFNAWRDADPEAGRTVEEYVAALAEHRAFQHRIADRELVLHQLRLDLGLNIFLRDISGLDPEIVFLLAAEHLREWCDETTAASR